MFITDDIRYAGVDDHDIDLFEGQYAVPNGISYNSYVIIDEKTTVFDTVDTRFTRQWLNNLETILGQNTPDYLIVQHMEPDHSANIAVFMEKYPNAQIVASARAFSMMNQFFGTDFAGRQVVVKENDTLSLGRHELTFYTAPMVHWPEVIVTYDNTDKVLFTADAFGKFGALDAEEEWTDEARRYYIGIVGKYGVQVQGLLKKAAKLDIQMLCPLHGPVLKEDISRYLTLYDTWSSYKAESSGVVIAYTSIYGNTRKAAELLADRLRSAGCPDVVLYDLARCDMSQAVADTFRYDRLVLATTTYNGDIFPFMKEFINHLTERGFRNRTIGLIENGTWAPMAARIIKKQLENSKDLTFTNTTVQIRSALSPDSNTQLEVLAKELCITDLPNF